MVGIVAQRAQRRRPDRKMPTFDHLETDPPRGEDRAELAVRKRARRRPPWSEHGQSTGPRARKPARVFLRSDSRRDRGSSQRDRCKCRPSGVPDNRHSPIPRDPVRRPGRCLRPESSQVARARSRGLDSTRENGAAATRGRSARACSSPWTVSAMSVVPVCRPEKRSVHFAMSNKKRMARPVRKGFFRDRRLISLLQRIRPRRSILPAKMEIRAPGPISSHGVEAPSFEPRASRSPIDCQAISSSPPRRHQVERIDAWRPIWFN